MRNDSYACVTHASFYGAGGLGYGSAAGTGATGGATDVAVAAAGAEADTAISISQRTHRGFLGALFFGGHL